MLLPDDAVESPLRAFREVVTESVEDEDVSTVLYRSISAPGGVEAISGTALHPPALSVRGVDFESPATLFTSNTYLGADFGGLNHGLIMICFMTDNYMTDNYMYIIYSSGKSAVCNLNVALRM